MEETKEKKETKNKKSSDEKIAESDQYLYAAIKAAEHINTSYKKFAEKYRNESVILRELYACIFDGVPLEILKVAAQKKPIEHSFRLCRRKHIESEILGTYSTELEEIREITEALEKDVHDMAGTVNQIADIIPTLDEMFPIPEQSRTVSSEQSAESDVTTKNEQSVENKPLQEEKNKNMIPKESMLRKLIKVIRTKVSDVFVFYREKDPARFVIELYSKGYVDAQINFILRCMEEGMTVSEIDKFADPKIPVEVMEKLRDMYAKKEDKDHGKR